MQSDLKEAVTSSKPAGYDLSNDQDREDRRKHLDLVSNVVSRMAAASAMAKGWSVTLAGAAFGVALVRDSWPLIGLGLVVLIAFGFLDARYLNNERRARGVYDAIADDNVITPLSLSGLPTAAGRKHRWWPDRFRSWSIAYFYVPLIFAGVLLLGYSLIAGSDDDDPAPVWPHQRQWYTK